MSCRLCLGIDDLVNKICLNCDQPYQVCALCANELDLMLPHCSVKRTVGESRKGKRKFTEEANDSSLSSVSSISFDLFPSTPPSQYLEDTEFNFFFPNDSADYDFGLVRLDASDESGGVSRLYHLIEQAETIDESMEVDVSSTTQINQPRQFIIEDFDTANTNALSLPPTELPACTFGNGGGHETTSNTERPVNLEIGVATWNINHLGKITNTYYSERNKKSRELAQKQRTKNRKITNKLATIERLFAQHKWLDVLILQEVNESSVIKLDDPTLEYIQGPRMKALAIGEKPKNQNSKSFKVTYDGVEEWAKPGQGEYYAVVIRKKTLLPDSWDITHEGCDIFYKDQLETEARMDASKPYYWSKLYGTAAKNEAKADDEVAEENADEGEDNEEEATAEQVQKDAQLMQLENLPTFRPIIIHKLKINDKQIKIAVVHTSPKGKNFFRKTVYSQVKELFKVVSEKSAAGEHWIVGGDYYLEPEATVDIDSNSYGYTEARNQKKNETSKVYEKYKAEHLKKLKAKKEKKEDLLAGKNKWASEGKKRKKGDVKLLLKEQFKDKFIREDKIANPEFKLKLAISLSATNQGRVTNDAAAKIVRSPEWFYGFYTKLPGDKSEYVSNSRADFFVCSPSFVFTYAGLMNPLGKTVLVVDTHHNALNWWSGISDHTPIGAVFSINNQTKKWEAIKQDLYNDAHQKMVEAQVVKMKTMACEGLADSLEILTKQILNLKAKNSKERANEALLRAAHCRLINSLMLIRSDFTDLLVEIYKQDSWQSLLAGIDKNKLEHFERQCLDYDKVHMVDAFEYAFYQVRQTARNLHLLCFEFTQEMFEPLVEEETFSSVNAALKA